MLRKNEKKEPLRIAFEIRLYHKPDTYSEVTRVHVKVEETIPPHVKPVEHIRQRVAEEIARQATNFESDRWINN